VSNEKREESFAFRWFCDRGWECGLELRKSHPTEVEFGKIYDGHVMFGFCSRFADSGVRFRYRDVGLYVSVTDVEITA